MKTAPEVLAENDVDAVYETSDGQVFMDIHEAEDTANKLENKEIKPYYKDAPARDLGQDNRDLQNVTWATDILKVYRVKRKPAPLYGEYVAAQNKFNREIIPEKIWNFIKSKVYRSNRPMHPGEKDHILTWQYGIVEAVFLRRYTQGQVFLYAGTLVFTCPTNTELMSGDIKYIFSPMFAAPKQPASVAG